MVSGRAFWATMLALALLIGYSFIQAVDLYSQASKSATEFPELARGMVPLEGIFVPTLGAFYLTSTLLLPFIAIRIIAQDKETGALKLLLQMPFTPAWLVIAKVAAVGVALMVLFLPALSFVPIWLYLGGHVHMLALLNLVCGHVLYALNVVGIAFLAAALSESLSTAAIFALAFTLAFWVLDFAATAGGGWLHRLSFYSLTGALHQFEQGLFSLPSALGMMLGAVSLFALTATWLPTGTAIKDKLLVSLFILLLFLLGMFGSSKARVYIDVTENRRNSFNPADEAALRRMQRPLYVWIYLSPEDSRLKEMEANVLGKLRRTVPHLEIRYEDTGGRGLFSSVPDERYGLIVYEYDGKRAESRSNSPREILPLLHQLGGTKVEPAREPEYRGYPLVADATGYALWFYGILPALILFFWWCVRRIGTSKTILNGGIPMSAQQRSKFLIFAAVILGLSAISVTHSQPRAAENKNKSKEIINDFSGETVGAEPASFVPAVGNWLIGNDRNNKVLVVDGRKWSEGQAAAGLADKARALYGERYAEFLDNVKAYAYFPFAVFKDLQDFKEGEISLRFRPLSGRIDQAAGIVFNLKPNGDYLVLRGSALENNLVLFQYVRGKRSPVKWIRNTPTAPQKWHDLKLEVSGTSVKGYLDGKLYLEHTLASPVSGKVGVWSKADSFVYIDDFQVRPKG